MRRGVRTDEGREVYMNPPCVGASRFERHHGALTSGLTADTNELILGRVGVSEGPPTHLGVL